MVAADITLGFWNASSDKEALVQAANQLEAIIDLLKAKAQQIKS